jgi:hypothetical protein
MMLVEPLLRNPRSLFVSFPDQLLCCKSSAFEEFFCWFAISANSFAEGVQSSLICNEIVEKHSCNWSVFCNFFIRRSPAGYYSDAAIRTLPIICNDAAT